jgi:hypothetical protein
MNNSNKLNSQKVSKKSDVIAGVLTFAIIASVIGFIAANYAPSTGEPVVSWIISGPFAIDKQAYRVGEPVFLIASDIGPQDKGEIVFIRPNGEDDLTFLFDGSKKAVQKHYFTPESESLNDCDTSDLIGTWKVVFRMFQGNTYPPLTFDILNETLLGSDEKYKEAIMCDD